jgi:hypothetical protein
MLLDSGVDPLLVVLKKLLPATNCACCNITSRSCSCPPARRGALPELSASPSARRASRRRCRRGRCRIRRQKAMPHRALATALPRRSSLNRPRRPLARPAIMSNPRSERTDIGTLRCLRLPG